MKTMNEKIERMLEARTFAVVGASTNPEKYGNIAYRILKEHGKTVYPVNPRATTVNGDPAFPSVASLPEVPSVVVAVIPPALTEQLVEELARVGVRNLWIQPGAESAKAVRDAEEKEIATVYGGPCIMVALRTHTPKPSG